jgi:hypothetical protein
MRVSCSQWGVPDNTPAELASLKAAIIAMASESSLDPRFIFAIIMQESTGCVRVITTHRSHFNPGLMQSHNGTGSCNTNNAPLGGNTTAGVVQSPCPENKIRQMVRDGTMGTAWGDGLVQLMQSPTAGARNTTLPARNGTVSARNETATTIIGEAQSYYRVARAYNGGDVPQNGILEDGCCSQSYASDVANRMMGWTNGAKPI